MSDGHVSPLRSSNDRRNYEGNAPQERRNSETVPVTARNSRTVAALLRCPAPHSRNIVSRQATFAWVKRMRSRLQRVAEGAVTGKASKARSGAQFLAAGCHVSIIADADGWDAR
jgi:hypothetical protein